MRLFEPMQFSAQKAAQDVAIGYQTSNNQACILIQLISLQSQNLRKTNKVYMMIEIVIDYHPTGSDPFVHRGKFIVGLGSIVPLDHLVRLHQQLTWYTWLNKLSSIINPETGVKTWRC